VEQTLRGRTEGGLLDDVALLELAVDQRDLTLVIHHREGTGDQLTTRPRTILASKGKLDPSQDVHRQMLGDLDTRLADTIGTRHRVLEQLNDGAVRTRADDVAQNRGQIPKLSG